MSKKSIACALACALAAATTIAAAFADTKPAAETARSCRTFVQSFYDWYLKQPQADRAYKYKSSAFSPELLGRLQADYAASAANKEEVVGLDFDPFLNTNAEPHARYVAGEVSNKDGNYLVHVNGMDNKVPDRDVVMPELSSKGGKWQFVNFHYKADKSPTDENLISILAELKKQRQASSGK